MHSLSSNHRVFTNPHLVLWLLLAGSTSIPAGATIIRPPLFVFKNINDTNAHINTHQNAVNQSLKQHFGNIPGGFAGFGLGISKTTNPYIGLGAVAPLSSTTSATTGQPLNSSNLRPNITRQSLASDAFVKSQIAASRWLPGGENFPDAFNDRGSVVSSTGNVTVTPTSSQQIGNFNLQTAVINGAYQYVNDLDASHTIAVHSPFDVQANASGSADNTTDTAEVRVDLQWVGNLSHPGNAYDGGPAGTGAVDIFSFDIQGNAAAQYFSPNGSGNNSNQQPGLPDLPDLPTLPSFNNQPVPTELRNGNSYSQPGYYTNNNYSQNNRHINKYLSNGSISAAWLQANSTGSNINKYHPNGLISTAWLQANRGSTNSNSQNGSLYALNQASSATDQRWLTAIKKQQGVQEYLDYGGPSSSPTLKGIHRITTFTSTNQAELNAWIKQNGGQKPSTIGSQVNIVSNSISNGTQFSTRKNYIDRQNNNVAAKNPYEQVVNPFGYNAVAGKNPGSAETRLASYQGSAGSSRELGTRLVGDKIVKSTSNTLGGYRKDLSSGVFNAYNDTERSFDNSGYKNGTDIRGDALSTENFGSGIQGLGDNGRQAYFDKQATRELNESIRLQNTRDNIAKIEQAEAAAKARAIAEEKARQAERARAEEVIRLAKIETRKNTRIGTIPLTQAQQDEAFNKLWEPTSRAIEKNKAIAARNAERRRLAKIKAAESEERNLTHAERKAKIDADFEQRFGKGKSYFDTTGDENSEKPSVEGLISGFQDAWNQTKEILVEGVVNPILGIGAKVTKTLGTASEPFVDANTKVIRSLDNSTEGVQEFLSEASNKLDSYPKFVRDNGDQAGEVALHATESLVDSFIIDLGIEGRVKERTILETPEDIYNFLGDIFGETSEVIGGLISEPFNSLLNPYEDYLNLPASQWHTIPDSVRQDAQFQESKMIQLVANNPEMTNQQKEALFRGISGTQVGTGPSLRKILTGDLKGGVGWPSEIIEGTLAEDNVLLPIAIAGSAAYTLLHPLDNTDRVVATGKSAVGGVGEGLQTIGGFVKDVFVGAYDMTADVVNMSPENKKIAIKAIITTIGVTLREEFTAYDDPDYINSAELFTEILLPKGKKVATETIDYWSDEGNRKLAAREINKIIDEVEAEFHADPDKFLQGVVRSSTKALTFEGATLGTGKLIKLGGKALANSAKGEEGMVIVREYFAGGAKQANRGDVVVDQYGTVKLKDTGQHIGIEKAVPESQAALAQRELRQEIKNKTAALTKDPVVPRKPVAPASDFPFEKYGIPKGAAAEAQIALDKNNAVFDIQSGNKHAAAQWEKGNVLSKPEHAKAAKSYSDADSVLHPNSKNIKPDELGKVASYKPVPLSEVDLPSYSKEMQRDIVSRHEHHTKDYISMREMAEKSVPEGRVYRPVGTTTDEVLISAPNALRDRGVVRSSSGDVIGFYDDIALELFPGGSKYLKGTELLLDGTGKVPTLKLDSNFLKASNPKLRYEDGYIKTAIKTTTDPNTGKKVVSGGETVGRYNHAEITMDKNGFLYDNITKKPFVPDIDGGIFKDKTTGEILTGGRYIAVQNDILKAGEKFANSTNPLANIRSHGDTGLGNDVSILAPYAFVVEGKSASSASKRISNEINELGVTRLSAGEAPKFIENPAYKNIYSGNEFQRELVKNNAIQLANNKAKIKLLQDYLRKNERKFNKDEIEQALRDIDRNNSN